MATPLPPQDYSYGAVPSAQDLAAMGMTPEQYADLQRSISTMDLSNIGLTGGLGLIGGYGPPGLDESKYMVKAPLSNKGNPTSTLSKSTNDFFVYDNQPVRLVDKATNQVVFEGSGPEDARKASELAAQLTAQGGRKASWDIQTGPGIDLSGYGAGQSEEWKTVANEKKNKSTLGVIGDIAGTALPIAVGFIPGFGQLATGLQIAAGAGAGAAGAGLRGDNILKGAVMGGLSSAGGTLVGDALKGATNLSANAARAIGTGIGTTAGGVVTGQSLENALLSGVASGGLSYLGGEAFGKRGTTPSGDVSGNIGSSGVELGDIVVNAGIPRFSGAVFTPSFADKAQLSSETTNRSIAEGGIGGSGVELGGLDPNAITVTAGVPRFSGSVFTPSFFDGSSDFAVKPDTDQQITEEEAPTEDEILVKGTRGPTTGSSNFAVSPTTTDSGLTKDEIEVIAKKKTDTGSSTAAVGGPDVDPEFGEDIEVIGKKTDAKETGTSVVPTNLLDQIVDPKVKEDLEKGKADDAKKKMDIADYLRLLGLTLGLVGGAGGGKGGGSTGKYTSRSNLPSTFSAKLPTPGQGGAFTVGGLGPRTPGAGGTFSARPVTDWYRYGMGRALDIPEGTDLSRATSPYAGYGPGTLGEETYRAVSGIPEEPVGMYGGGAMGYSRGSSRESFAVNGPGTGRSDDIPAVLSDGEYVIDAETVALLGDGSSKAGAKKLDEMRVKIRKAKGKNLAKGKFSVNAKRPEAYMSGGRI